MIKNSREMAQTYVGRPSQRQVLNFFQGYVRFDCGFGTSLYNGPYEYGYHFCNYFQLTPRRRLTLVQISDALTNSISRYIIPTGVANLVFEVPKHARSVRGGLCMERKQKDGLTAYGISLRD